MSTVMEERLIGRYESGPQSTPPKWWQGHGPARRGATPLLLGALLAMASGCQTPESDKEEQAARYFEQARQSKSIRPGGGDHRGLAAIEFSNGGFEFADFSGWAVGDNGFSPLFPWTVCSPFACGFFFNNEPVEGDFNAVNGFDGGAGYEAFLFQDVEVPDQGGTIALADRIQFDSLGLPSFQSRVYELQLRDPGDALLEILHHEEIFLNGQPYTDLGWRQRSFDVSAHAGETVRLYVHLFVPEDFTGPAQLEIDDVRLIPGDGGGGGGDADCELALEGLPGTAATGAPFVLDMDFANLGASFDARVAVLLIADGQVSTLHTESDVALSEGFQITDFPVYSTLALPPLPPSVGFLVAIFDEASRGLACSNVAIVGVDGVVSADSAATIRQLAQQYLDTAGELTF
jgi:hypothetical protein